MNALEFNKKLRSTKEDVSTKLMVNQAGANKSCAQAVASS